MNESLGARMRRREGRVSRSICLHKSTKRTTVSWDERRRLVDGGVEDRVKGKKGKWTMPFYTTDIGTDNTKSRSELFPNSIQPKIVNAVYVNAMVATGGAMAMKVFLGKLPVRDRQELTFLRTCCWYTECKG